MDIVILNKSDKPIYEQIYEQIAAQIFSGNLLPNSSLASIRSLAKGLGIGIITVKQAYELLEQNDLIYTRAGKGCFVSEHTEQPLKNKKLSLAKSRLKKDIGYYKNLNLTLEEFIELIKKEY